MGNLSFLIFLFLIKVVSIAARGLNSNIFIAGRVFNEKVSVADYSGHKPGGNFCGTVFHAFFNIWRQPSHLSISFRRPGICSNTGPAGNSGN
jgi:hypothetical protein